METRTTQEQIEELHTIMENKMSVVVDYVRCGYNEHALIELAALNEFMHLQYETMVKFIPGKLI